MLKHGEFTMHSFDENDDLLFSVTIKGPEAEEDFWHNELKIKVAMALIEGTKFDSFFEEEERLAQITELIQAMTAWE